jgi:hypothetical protein
MPMRELMLERSPGVSTVSAADRQRVVDRA